MLNCVYNTMMSDAQMALVNSTIKRSGCLGKTLKRGRVWYGMMSNEPKKVRRLQNRLIGCYGLEYNEAESADWIDSVSKKRPLTHCTSSLAGILKKSQTHLYCSLKLPHAPASTSSAWFKVCWMFFWRLIGSNVARNIRLLYMYHTFNTC